MEVVPVYTGVIDAILVLGTSADEIPALGSTIIR
jgi:hypothetical protein